MVLITRKPVARRATSRSGRWIKIFVQKILFHLAISKTICIFAPKHKFSKDNIGTLQPQRPYIT
jgi:hypothetical protein